MCEDLTRYDAKPKAMINYLRYYGWHFSKAMSDYAASLMIGKDDKPIEPYTKEKLESLLKNHNIKLNNNKILYDHVFVANMCKADLLGESVPTEAHLAKYVKNVIDDKDGYDGVPFTRWYADMCRKGIPINWSEML